MAGQDFQDRLNRIGANQPRDGQTRAQSAAVQTSGARPFRVVFLVLGAILIFVGSQAIKFANQNYDQAVQADDSSTIVIFAAGGLLAMIVGCFVMFRALPKRARVQNHNAGAMRVKGVKPLPMFLGSGLIVYGFLSVKIANEGGESALGLIGGAGVLVLGCALVLLAMSKSGELEAIADPATELSRRRLHSYLSIIQGFLVAFLFFYILQLDAVEKSTGVKFDGEGNAIVFGVWAGLFSMWAFSLIWAMRFLSGQFFRIFAFGLVGMLLFFVLFAIKLVDPFEVIDSLGFVH
ncbi:MAG: hypothetical protein ABJF50_14955 [Paracoccaceae bacterium]